MASKSAVESGRTQRQHQVIPHSSNFCCVVNTFSYKLDVKIERDEASVCPVGRWFISGFFELPHERRK